MSIQSEIDRINGNVADTYTVLSDLGATMPTARNSNNLPATAASVPRATDYIVESGEGDTYSYHRWNSGRIDIWCTFTVSSLAVSTAIGNWYRSNTVTCNWPISITPDAVNFSWTSNSGHGAVLWNTAFNSTGTKFYLIRPTSSSGASGTIHVYATGK